MEATRERVGSEMNHVERSITFMTYIRLPALTPLCYLSEKESTILIEV